MQEQLTRPEVEFIFSPVINFSMQQNHMPVIRRLALKNSSARMLQNLCFKITAEPDFDFPEDLLFGRGKELW